MKRILFVIESLNLGGAEKSLVTLLNLLDYSKYQVDLLLFAQGGPFQELLPRKVNLLPVPEYFAYTSISWKNLGRKLKEPKKFFAQLHYSISIRTGKHNHVEKAVLFWKASRHCFGAMQKEYDVAIAYAQGIPTFFVAEKVRAKKKAAWINVTYLPKGKYLNYIKPMYDQFDYVNAVSESVRQQMQNTFAIPDTKTIVIKDILDVRFAYRMAEMPSNAEKEMPPHGLRILTVGRLAYMKGHDIAIEAARLLEKCGIDFIWYFLGEGSLRKKLEEQISSYDLQEKVILLGSSNNPYPYFRACDLYVQPSRFEGFGITLAEAKMFRKPIVTTNFDAVGAQFINEKNGLIVDISAQAIADGILRMLTDAELRERCITNLAKEKIGNTEEIEKFYQMVES